jgi:aquaporin Z
MRLHKTESKLFLSEAIGTAVLLFFGLSFVIFNWGEGSVVVKLIPSEPLRRLLTGFLFGSVGCLVTLSPVGKISGAHINPAVSLAFWLAGKMNSFTMMRYILAQMIGAALGCLPLLLWGQQGSSIEYGITLPGEEGLSIAFIGEVVTTACLIFYLYIFIGTARLRDYTPFGIPFLYSILTWAEAPYSGCSTNPARSFGPAVVAHNFHFYGIYWVAPVIGVLLVTTFFRIPIVRRTFRMKSARVSYHDLFTPESLKKGLLTTDSL